MAGRWWGEPPGILTLLDLIEEHRGAFEYDWRTRFHLPLAVPDLMGYGEAFRLTRILAGDPSSQVASVLADWSHPVSREWLALHALNENFVAAKTEKRPRMRPLAAPWDPKPVKYGTAAMSPAAMRRLLAQHRASTEVDDGN